MGQSIVGCILNYLLFLRIFGEFANTVFIVFMFFVVEISEYELFCAENIPNPTKHQAGMLQAIKNLNNDLKQVAYMHVCNVKYL